MEIYSNDICKDEKYLKLKYLKVCISKHRFLVAHRYFCFDFSLIAFFNARPFSQGSAGRSRANLCFIFVNTQIFRS